MQPTGHKVSPETVEEFRRIYKELSEEEITAGEASYMAHRLLALDRLISCPLPGEKDKPPLSPPPCAVPHPASAFDRGGIVCRSWCHLRGSGAPTGQLRFRLI